jgi:hypothetical protein
MKKNGHGYGLLHVKSGNIVGFSTSNNAGGHDCCEEQYSLDYTSEQLWIVKDEINAAYVRMFSTEWYNAGYNTPTNPYKIGELQVIKIEFSVHPVILPKLLDRKEYIERKYNTPGKKSYDPTWAKFRLEEADKCDNKSYAPYSLYELYDFLKEGY